MRQFSFRVNCLPNKTNRLFIRLPPFPFIPFPSSSSLFRDKLQPFLRPPFIPLLPPFSQLSHLLFPSTTSSKTSLYPYSRSTSFSQNNATFPQSPKTHPALPQPHLAPPSPTPLGHARQPRAVQEYRATSGSVRKAFLAPPLSPSPIPHPRRRPRQVRPPKLGLPPFANFFFLDLLLKERSPRVVENSGSRMRDSRNKE